jgi:hypothetical protein
MDNDDGPTTTGARLNGTRLIIPFYRMPKASIVNGHGPSFNTINQLGIPRRGPPRSHFQQTRASPSSNSARRPRPPHFFNDGT